MTHLTLWKQLKDLQSPRYKWVDLSHEVSPDTPHWHGFSPMSDKILFDFHNAPMRVYEYTLPGQYGTHVDAPSHFVKGARSLEQIEVKEFAYALCVVDKSEEVKQNNDYALTIQDLIQWEEKYCKIPEGAFVAFRSDWYKKTAAEFDNKDAEGNAHYPGWDIEAVKWLVTKRNIGAIGHETSDTDPACRQSEIGFAAELYILEQNKFQIEIMRNLDQLPPVGAVIFCTFPKIKNATGFSARCFAICPVE